MSRTCKSCKQSLPETEFHSRNGKVSVRKCKRCVSQMLKDKRNRFRETCISCGVVKSYDCFRKERFESDPKMCKSCELRQHYVEEQKCDTCEKLLSAKSFARNFTLKTGYLPTCKPCTQRKQHEEKKLSAKTFVSEKFCNGCKRTLPRESYNASNTSKDGLLYRCKTCFNSLTRRLKKAVAAAKRTSEKRGKADASRGQFDLTYEILLRKYHEQKGRCYISGISMVTDTNHLYTISVERIDNSKGETDDNVVLACHCFNHKAHMSREKFYFLAYHQDQPMSDDELKYELSQKGIFEKMASACHTMDRARGLTSDMTVEALRQKFVDQRGLCAYSGIRMQVGSNLGAFQASIERVDRTKPHTVENVVLIILGLNIGGSINLTPEIVKSWRCFPDVPEKFDCDVLRAKWDEELKLIRASYRNDRICSSCRCSKSWIKFTCGQEGTFYVKCYECRQTELKRKLHELNANDPPPKRIRVS